MKTIRQASPIGIRQLNPSLHYYGNPRILKAIVIEKRVANTRDILVQQLLKNNVFWSYDFNEEQGSCIPDELLIESTLLHGDVEQLFLLFSLFPESQLLNFWENSLVPHEKYRRINHYLGLFFFHIKDISSFLNKRIGEHPRLERLKLLAAQNQENSGGFGKV